MMDGQKQTGVAAFNAGGTLNALAASPDRDHVAVAGRDILKVLAVNENQITEAVNLRMGSRLNLNFSSNDVKWGGHFAQNTIVTAATNGSIVVWDMQKTGQKQERVIIEHSRAVNRIAMHPTEAAVLISASQDGTMKLWDLRTAGVAKLTFEGRAESVRDIQFAPSVQHEFVAVFENGSLQKWDTRNPHIYEKKMNAHNGLALSVDYQSDGRLVVTGGRDKLIKVWDMKLALRRPVYSIQAIASVSRVVWRPGQELQIASSALLTDYRIHIHDVTRPYVPVFTLNDHGSVTTGMCWVNSDVIWSCSKDKKFVRRDVRSGAKPLDTLPANAIAWSCNGDIAFAVEDYGPIEKCESTKTPLLSQSIFSRRTQRKAVVTERVMLKLPLYKPSQKLGNVDTETFDPHGFTMKAMYYMTSSANVGQACLHNAQVARELEHHRSSQTWTILHLLYSQTKDVEEEIPEEKSAKYGDLTPLDTSEFSRQTPIGTPQPHSAFNASLEHLSNKPTLPFNRAWDSTGVHRFMSGSVSSMSGIQDSSMLLPRSVSLRTQPTLHYNSPTRSLSTALADLDMVVRHTMDFYADQGDVQMCVTIALILESRIQIENRKLEAWQLGYIELLHRFQLWSIATSIIRASQLPSIRAHNQESTTVYTTCNNCFKPILNINGHYWHCERCKNAVNACSLCHLPVKGVYVWCQGCSHGGHLRCLQEWFTEYNICPTGCGHDCDVKMNCSNTYTNASS